MQALPSSSKSALWGRVGHPRVTRVIHSSRPPARISSHRLQSAVSDDQLTYAKAGVDIDAGDELVKRIQKLNPSIGGFSGLVPFGDSFLVAGTDGVGTKLKLAFDMNKVCIYSSDQSRDNFTYQLSFSCNPHDN